MFNLFIYNGFYRLYEFLLMKYILELDEDVYLIIGMKKEGSDLICIKSLGVNGIFHVHGIFMNAPATTVKQNWPECKSAKLKKVQYTNACVKRCLCCKICFAIISVCHN